jgi:hypothetical protein
MAVDPTITIAAEEALNKPRIGPNQSESGNKFFCGFCSHADSVNNILRTIFTVA